MRGVGVSPLLAFQRHYEELIADYNDEKDSVIIERTFEALLTLAQAMSEEERRAVREGLDEETPAAGPAKLQREAAFRNACPTSQGNRR